MRLILPALLAAALLPAQIPRIGIIDFYGQQRLSEERLRKLLKIEEGDRLPASKANLEDRLEQLPEVVRAHVAAGRYYQALKSARPLLQYERELISRVP